MTTAIVDAAAIRNAAERALPHAGTDAPRVAALIKMTMLVPEDAKGFRRISIGLDDFELISKFV